jgi:hypothetical protein
LPYDEPLISAEEATLGRIARAVLWMSFAMAMFYITLVVTSWFWFFLVFAGLHASGIIPGVTLDKTWCYITIIVHLAINLLWIITLSTIGDLKAVPLFLVLMIYNFVLVGF